MLKVLAKKLVQVISSKEGNRDVPCLKVDLTKPQQFFLQFSSTWPSFNFGFVASSLHLRICDTTFISAASALIDFRYRRRDFRLCYEKALYCFSRSNNFIDFTAPKLFSK